MSEKLQNLALATWLSVGPLVVGGFASAFILSDETIIQNSPFLVFGLAGILMGLALLPTTIFALLAGYTSGWVGFLVCLGLYVPAASLGYYLGLWVLPKKLLHAITSRPGARRVIASLQQGGWLTVFWLRISPVVPFGIGNVLMAWGGLPWRAMALGSITGMVPRTLLAIYTGMQAKSLTQAMQQGVSGTDIAWAVLFFLVAAGGLYLQVVVAKKQSDKQTKKESKKQGEKQI